MKEIKVNFLQTLKFHGVYKPPKPKPKRQKPGKAAKAKKKQSLLKKKTAKVRPAREPTAIKKTKVIKMINDDTKFSNGFLKTLVNDLINGFSWFQTQHNTISSELVGTAAGNDTKTFEIEFAIPEVPSSHVDADGIGIFYSIQVKVY